VKKQASAFNNTQNSQRPLICATISPIPEDRPTGRSIFNIKLSNIKAHGIYVVLPVFRQNEESETMRANESIKLQTKKKGWGQLRKHVVGGHSMGQSSCKI
jgi:hypothetical protein